MSARPIIQHLGRSLGMGHANIPSTRYIIGVHLTNSHRTKSQSCGRPKSKTGKAIKQLNTENKYLFGELLDRTKPTKTKTGPAVKQTSWTPRPRSRSPAQPLDGIQSELSWYKSNKLRPSPLNTIHAESESEYIDDTRLRPRSTITYSETNQCGPSIDRNLSLELPQQSDSQTNDTIFPSATYGKTKEVMSIDTTSKPRPMYDLDRPISKQSLELPDIIIRNISTFPLFNNEKINEDQSLHNKASILNISRDNSKYFKYPSVTNVLNATMSDASKAALARWRQKMIAELGEEGFLKYSKALLAKGSEFHQTIHDHLSGIPSTELTIGADIVGSWHSLSSIIPDLSDVKVLESHVVHPKLMYRGVIDCVASYKGKTAVVEWKKSDRQKKELAYTYDAPLQLAAYLGAINYDPNYHFQVRGGVVVVAYTDGTPAQVFQLSQSECARYWSLWLHRLQLYWQQQANLSSDTTVSAL